MKDYLVLGIIALALLLFLQKGCRSGRKERQENRKDRQEHRQEWKEKRRFGNDDNNNSQERKRFMDRERRFRIRK